MEGAAGVTVGLAAGSFAAVTARAVAGEMKSEGADTPFAGEMSGKPGKAAASWSGKDDGKLAAGSRIEKAGKSMAVRTFGLDNA